MRRYLIYSGVHHQEKNCDPTYIVTTVQKFLTSAHNSLYPFSLNITVDKVSTINKPRVANGGWGDERDHKLCLNFVRSPNQLQQ